MPARTALGDPRHYRPAPDGSQRESNYPNVHWRDEHGVVHQASGYCNLTLCENNQKFRRLMHWTVIETTTMRVTCLACIGDITWRYYPLDVEPGPWEIT